MKVKIKVHPNSSQEKINKLADHKYEIWIKEKPINSKANTALLKLLKKHFHKPVKIISGFSSKTKLVEVLD